MTARLGRKISAIVVSAGLLSPCGPRPALPDGVRPERFEPFDAQVSSARCASCHAEIVREWQASPHRRSFTNAWFAAAYRAEPTRFCRGCHAPLARGAIPDEVEADEGVSCAVCHVRGDAIVGARPGNCGGASRTIEDARWSGAELCGGCHQFAFETKTSPDDHEMMQMTISEWRSSDAAMSGVACRDCHMPWRGSTRRWRAHDFVATDPESLAGALDVEPSVTRLSASVIDVTFTVRAGFVGHAVPTGDVFRNFRLVVESGQHRDSATLARTWRSVALAGGLAVRRLDRDLRVPVDGAQVVHLRLEAPAGGQVTWLLAYRRTSPDIARAQNVDVGERVVLAGSLAAP